MKKSVESSTTTDAGLGKVVLGRFDVGSVGYNQEEGCHVFTDLLTPLGRITWVKLYDELLPDQDLAQVRRYNTTAASEDLPVRIPLFLDYALAAASLMRLQDPKCKFRKHIEHCHKNVWIPDAKRRLYHDGSADGSLDRVVGSSTVLINRSGRPSGVIHGVGLPRSHDLYYAQLIRGNADKLSYRARIGGLVLEDNRNRYVMVNSWRMDSFFGNEDNLMVLISEAEASTSVAQLEALAGTITICTYGKLGFGSRGVEFRSCGGLNAAISSDLQLPARGVKIGRRIAV